ncbi:MAG: Biopolymer transport protein ExbD/TolR [Myxococcaceae bacterium]|nr:Biopolymer transport protein ExbD/TolR [Myxococcaceae bacterium]
MGGNGARSPSGAITGINVTPLVDITLVLLIIFMVTAKLIVSPKALHVELPKAAKGTEVQEIFSIILFENGATRVDGAELTSEDDILALAQNAKAKTADLRAVIKADGAVPHRRVMHVLDLLKQAGVAKIGFGVVPIPATSSQPAK